MNVFKSGLYNNKELDSDIPVGRYKPYVYTNKEASVLAYKDKIPVLLVSSKEPLKIQNCILYLKSKEYDLTKYNLQGICELIREDGVQISYIDGYPEILTLPAIMLSNCNNTKTTQVEGISSPLTLESFNISNNTIFPVDGPYLSNINVFDLETNQEKAYSTDGDSITFDVSVNTTVIVQSFCETYLLLADYDTKYTIDGARLPEIIHHSNKLFLELPIPLPPISNNEQNF